MRHIVVHVRNMDFAGGFSQFSGIVLVLMDIANARRTGNSILLKSNGKSVGISGIRGMNTSLPFAHPVRIVASIR